MCAWFRSLFRRSPKAQSMDLDVMWGGYYTSRDPKSGQFTVFRLLDFNLVAYHAALFREKFPHPPGFAEASALTAAIGHVPLDARGLVAAPLQLLGSTPLTAADLEGYMIYLEHHDVAPDARAELGTRLIGFSQQVPLRLRLGLNGEQLTVAPRD